MDHRSRRLMEELDRHTRERREKRPRLSALRDWLWGRTPLRTR
jgi:hypothetical protein